ncbi:MAG TPA: HAMP domain-containing sensor histidine kinase [Candidatus Acidoferrales bacterium]|nr:HAMP domain-containing sensor histidine kinase [Candidatus Acidoferrales bacterium]
MLDFDELTKAIGVALERGAVVPLLALRLPEFAQVAWRDGKRSARLVERRTAAAFRAAACRIVRDGDALAHASGSDCFAIAMLAPARAGRPPGVADLRCALERIAAEMSLSTGRRIETGWWPIRAAAEIEDFAQTFETALDRGRRERERAEMLATVGHELRTPLTSIRGYLETLLDEEPDPPTSRRFLETARREAVRLGRLVDGMLEFSLLDLSPPDLLAGCDVVETIGAAVDALLPLARRRGMTIRASLPPRAYAAIDADACMHALLNLMENAVKYGREGGCIAIECIAGKARIDVVVEDDGPGIPVGSEEAIFRLGVRAANERPGNGIGLAVVKAIIDRSGGDVSARASPLGGARFTVQMPAHPSE